MAQQQQQQQQQQQLRQSQQHAALNRRQWLQLHSLQQVGGDVGPGCGPAAAQQATAATADTWKHLCLFLSRVHCTKTPLPAAAAVTIVTDLVVAAVAVVPPGGAVLLLLLHQSLANLEELVGELEAQRAGHLQQRLQRPPAAMAAGC
jgi:hypothetical protein